MSLRDYCSVKELFTYGEEQKFWKCVSEAAL